MWDCKSDAHEALQSQHSIFLRDYIHLLYTTTKTSRNQLHLCERLTPSPPSSVGSLPLWLHHRHLPALESRIEGSFLVVAFATTSPQTIETRLTKVVGCQNCCQRFCQRSNAVQEHDLLADMATPTKHHSINWVKKVKTGVVSPQRKENGESDDYWWVSKVRSI